MRYVALLMMLGLASAPAMAHQVDCPPIPSPEGCCDSEPSDSCCVNPLPAADSDLAPEDSRPVLPELIVALNTDGQHPPGDVAPSPKASDLRPTLPLYLRFQVLLI